MGGMAARILVVDDEAALARGLERLLRHHGFEAESAPDGPAALRAAAARAPDLVLLDLRLAGESGLGVLDALRRAPLPPEVIMVTGYGSIPDAVEALRRGAADFVEKPVTAERLLQAIERTLGGRPRPDDAEATGLLGESPLLQRLRRSLRLAAEADGLTVLLQGESGTGKELAARSLHALGPRRDGPFVALNCAALPATLLEAELFGYDQGAFTGAAPGGRAGLFRAAERGTLFLDEVAELPPAAQAKLLRVLETGVLRPVGAAADVPVDVRVIAATHRDLARETREGRFREDLWYRLHVLRLVLPPLRERPDDVLPLARHFLAAAAARLRRRPAPALTPEAEAALLAHPWPGNVRELKNAIERAVALSAAGEPIGPDHLALEPASAPAAPAGRELRALEKEHIRAALEEAGGNMSRAARALGIHRSTLYDKAARHGLTPRREAPCPT
jgi:DNA-binding NtrC family response regulator